MFFDPQSLPATGGTLAAGLVYGIVSLFITGPVVGERLVEKSGWYARCPALVETAARQETPAAPIMPRLDCRTVMAIFGPDSDAYCRKHGHVFDNNPVTQMVDGLSRQQREIEKARLDYATAGATGRCDCAAGVALEENRTALAIYAGSLRVIAPHGVKTLESRVERALSTPVCAAMG